MKALIFGASGSVGQEVLKNIQAQNIPAHAVRRNAGSASTSNTTWFTHDIQEGPGSAALWKDVTHVFVMAPPGQLNHEHFLNPIVTKAKEQNIQKLVLLSAMGANHAVGSPLQKAEVFLQNSGVPYAIVRPNWFMQNFHTYWGQALRQDKSVIVPAGNAKTSFIDVRDIGAVAAKLLTGPQTGAFDITGAEALTHAEVAAILSETLDTRIRYVDAEPKAFEQALIQAGLTKEYAAFMMIILGALREGHASAITPHVEQILGRKPIRFADYARDFRRSLQ